MQNWNDGKREEFKDRKVYNVETSHFHGADNCACTQTEEKNVSAEKSAEADLSGVMLFATKTCPNCKMSKMMLDKAGVKYTVVDAEENKEVTVNFGVKKAPTLLVPTENGFERYENASNIKKYIEGLN